MQCWLSLQSTGKLSNEMYYFVSEECDDMVNSTLFICSKACLRPFIHNTKLGNCLHSSHISLQLLNLRIVSSAQFVLVGKTIYLGLYVHIY